MDNYTQQAKDFLQKTNTTLTIQKALPQKVPLWHKKGEKHGINYAITLSNARGSYTFDFWNSIAKAEYLESAQYCVEKRDTNNPHGDKVLSLLKEHNHPIGLLRLQTQRLLETVEKLIEPDEYDILACLSPLYEETFEDFCASFGYDEDSIMALKTYEGIKEQDHNIRRLFTHEEIAMLEEIQ